MTWLHQRSKVNLGYCIQVVFLGDKLTGVTAVLTKVVPRKCKSVLLTMSITIMDSKSLVLLYWGWRWFIQGMSRKEYGYACFCCFLPPCWNTSRFHQGTVKNSITHDNLWHCRISLLISSQIVRQPLSKQLYSWLIMQ